MMIQIVPLLLLLAAGPALAQGEGGVVGSSAGAPSTADRTAADASAPAPGAAAYTVDGSRGLVFVKVFKDSGTLASGLSHNHVVRAEGLEGTVVWDPHDASACKVDLSLPVQELQVDPQWLRDRVGFTGHVDDGDRRAVRKNMLSRSQLHASEHAAITFSSTECSGGAGSFEVSGGLRVRGVIVPVRVLLRVDADGSSLSAHGRFSARGTDFGFAPYTALLGALKNQDELHFSVHIEADAG